MDDDIIKCRTITTAIRSNPVTNDMTPLVQTEKCQLIHIIYITGYAYLLILSSQTLPHTYHRLRLLTDIVFTDFTSYNKPSR